MPKFIMLVGLPAIGKDYWANKYKEEHPEVVIYSSDDIRGEIFGDIACQKTPEVVFGEMQNRTLKSLRAGKDVIYNATNVSYKDRKGILFQVKNTKIKDIEILCNIFVAPVEVCKERNSARERSVPDYVYDKMLRRWQTPCKWEGFDNIEVIYTDKVDSSKKYCDLMRNFDQKNHHHQYNLYEHCKKAAEHADEALKDTVMQMLMYDALFMHDVGKLFTQSEPDEKGDCHYINHENFGAYIMLACGLPLFGSQLTTWHMLPYMKDKKGLEVWQNRMGTFFTNWLDIFHECDMKGH